MFYALLVVLGVVSFSLMYKRISKGNGISILVPFQSDDPQRLENWRWLKSYWRAQLPGAELIMGIDKKSLDDPRVPFSKSTAVNYAARKATGDVLAIIDADGYVNYESVLHCAKEIREARKRGQRLWFVPYRWFYRLTKIASRRVLNSSPKTPYQFPHPPDVCDIQDTGGSQFGHWFGAMIQILPTEAFWLVGGWDERFRGWGGEDHAVMRATDTLYWPHKTQPEQVLHIWHPMFQTDSKHDWVDWRYRVWKNQTASGANDRLSGRYYGAQGNSHRMRKLVDEWKFGRGLT